MKIFKFFVMVLALTNLVIPITVNSQINLSGPLSQDDYDFLCGRLGGARGYCESNLRLVRGGATCEDIKWQYSCKVNSMTDEKVCVANSISNLFVYAKKGRISFGITGQEYPGEPSFIRVDANKAISFDHYSGTTRAQDNTIEKQINSGETIKTKYVEWPSGVSKNQEFPVCNLPDVINSMKAESK